MMFVFLLFWIIAVLSVRDMLELVADSEFALGDLFSVFWLFGVLWVTYMIIFKTPIEIKVLDSKMIEFRSLLKTVAIPVSDIKSLKMEMSQYRLKYSSGSLVIPSQMDGFHEFVAFIKAENSNATITGI